MKTADFNKAYEYALRVNVCSDDWFNTAGWFWINLTDKQLSKMVSLLIAQGAEVKESGYTGWNHMVTLQNGVGLRVD